MSLPPLTARLDAAVTEAKGATAILHDVANGDDTTTVMTASGPVPSVAKWLKDVNDRTTGEVGVVQADLDAHKVASDPHPQYMTAPEVDDVMEAHLVDPNPHPQYATDADLAPVSAAALMDASQTGNFTAAAGKRYWLPNSQTVTLPATGALAVGAWVEFGKALAALPVIQTGSAVLIKTAKGTDTSVLFDINAEITFVWNGTEWEV